MKKANDELEVLTNKNREQAKRVKQGETTLRGIENDLDQAYIDLDGLQTDNADMNAEHKLLNTEIDAILVQILECEKVNAEMNREIENYIQYDEEARSLMDRKTAMRKMLETVNAKLGQTGSHIAHLR